MPSVCRTAAPRRGAVMVWLVLCLGVIITIVALGTDGGRMMEERRRAQAAADAAALAAAGDLYQNYQGNQGGDPSGSAAQAAQASAASNGYAASAVTVNIPPQSGSFAGKAGYVEVVIQSHLQGSFSAAFGSGDLAVRARAVARGMPQQIGLMALQPSGAGTLTVSGSANVQLAGGAVVNSTNAAAVTISGSATVSASAIAVAGGYSGTSLSTPVYTGVEPSPDPLRTFPQPNPADPTVQSTSALAITSGPVLLQPGVYQGGINISGNGSVQLAPGVYIMQGGGFQVSGTGSVSGTGVMIFNTGGASAGPIGFSGNGTVNLTAPTDGVYRGVSIFQDRSLSLAVTLTGNATTQISGTVYAAGAAVVISGNGTSTTNTLGGAYVAGTVQISGSSSFKVDLGNTRPEVPDVRLVE